MSSLDDRLTVIINEYPASIAVPRVREQFRKSGYKHMPTFMTEFEKQLAALDLSRLRHSHKHNADAWVKEVVLETVKRSLKDA